MPHGKPPLEFLNLRQLEGRSTVSPLDRTRGTPGFSVARGLDTANAERYNVLLTRGMTFSASAPARSNHEFRDAQLSKAEILSRAKQLKLLTAIRQFQGLNISNSGGS
jgi:hypothetical protein